MNQVLDAEFFAALRLDLPELAEVKRAAEAQDWPAARAALIAYLRERERPLPPQAQELDERTGGDCDQEVMAGAERVLQHTFTLVGYPPTQIGARIAWNEDPVGYDQWAISLNRHFSWITLGRAYELTGDERYAREFVAQLLSWVEAMPVQIGERYYQGLADQEGLVSLSLDAGIRMGQTWVPAYYYFRRSPSFGVDAQIAMVKAFYEHALYLMQPQHFRQSSNWGAMETNGLFHIAAMFPEFRAAQQWLDTALARLSAALDSQVYPDGAQIELSTSYHQVSLKNFYWPLALGRRNGIAFPPDYVAKLEKMFDFNLGMLQPDGALPRLHDAGDVPLRPIFQVGHTLFPQRTDYLWAATGGEQGEPPSKTSWAFPYAGYLVMRTGWGPNDKYLLLDVGPFGHAHQHEDKLNLVCLADGKAHIIDTGNYNYDQSLWRQHILSSAAHNTLLVDGQGQNRRAERALYDVEQPLPFRWETGDRFDYAEGTYDDGYGPGAQRLAAHTRRVLFAKPDYWIVTDQLVPGDDQPHEYEAIFHLDTEQAEFALNSIRTHNTAEATLTILWPSEDDQVEVRVLAGQREPLRGWIQHITGKDQTVRPLPVADFRRRAQGITQLLYVLYPLPTGAECPVQVVNPLSVETDGRWAVAVEIVFRDGRKDFFAQRDGTGSWMRLGARSTLAPTLLVRLDRDGKVHDEFGN